MGDIEYGKVRHILLGKIAGEWPSTEQVGPGEHFDINKCCIEIHHSELMLPARIRWNKAIKSAMVILQYFMDA